MPYVDVLGVRIGDRVLRKLHRTLVCFEHRHARSADIRQHETPNLPYNQQVLNLRLYTARALPPS